MKIQNKRAKIWIYLGLIGLILFMARRIVGPFGGVILEMFSDVEIIFLLVGLHIESKGKKDIKVSGKE
jgi:hypothetical protein